MERSAPAARPAPAALDPRRWPALALLCGAFFMVLLDGTITIVALPSIGADLGFARQDLLGGIGATTAWLIGGPLVDGPGWRWIFFINVPVGLAALALSPVLLRESRAALARRSYDPAGALTITGALVLLVYAVVKAPDAGWGDAQTILPLAGSALLVAAFAVIESRHPAPLVPLRILRSRTLAGADALTVLIGTVAVGMPFVLTLYAQRVLGYSAVRFGIGSVVLAAAVTAGAVLGQAAVLVAGFRSVAATGMVLMGAGSLVLAQVSVHGSYFPDIFFGLLLCGLGIGLAFVTATVAALAGVAGPEAGLASGLSNTALQVGTALGVAIVSTVAVSRSADYLAANTGANPLVALTEGYRSAFVACAVLAGVGLALALLLPGRPRKARQEHPDLAPAVSEQPAQVRRVLDPRTSRLEQLDRTGRRRAGRGLDAEARTHQGHPRPRQLRAGPRADGARPGR